MPYDLDQIRALISGCEHYNGDEIFYFEEIDSTNTWLSSCSNLHGRVCLAERQTAGKGRLGRAWVSCDEGSVLLSLGWSLHGRNPSGLSLASGIAVVGALSDCGVSDVRLKWPNDIIIDGRKLGGILVELSNAGCVIGIGVNVNIPQDASSVIGQPWVDLASLGYAVSREVIVASLVRHHERVLLEFNRSGFEPFVERWNGYCAHIGKEVETVGGVRKISGKSIGADESGALLVQAGDGIEKIVSGEISLRVVT